MDDSNIGLTIAAALMGLAFLKRKKAEAELAKATDEKPTLAVAPAIPEGILRVQDTIKQESIPPMAVVPVIEPSNPEPIVQPMVAQPDTSSSFASQVVQKLKELTQQQVVPTTQSVVTQVEAITTPIITTPPPTSIVPIITTPIVTQPQPQTSQLISVEAKTPIIETVPPTTQVAIIQPVTKITTTPTIQPATTTTTATKPIEEVVTLSDASQPLIAEIDRTIIPPEAAIGFNLLDPFDIGSKVLEEAKRAESRVRKELKRAEQHIRYELRRFEIRVRKNLSAIASVLSILGYVFPILKVAAYALDAMAAYRDYSTAKKIKKQIEGQQQYITEVNAEAERMLASPTSLAIKTTGGTLGYLFKNRINSAFIPLVSVSNTDLNDNFYTTIDMIPVLNAAQFIPGRSIGYICKIPFSGSIPLKLLYSFEMMDFVTVTSGSRYYQELLSNGYIEVKQLGYVSKSPQEGPFTSKDATEVERIK